MLYKVVNNYFHKEMEEHQIKNIQKLSLVELEDLQTRLTNICKNNNVIKHLPDKGKQLQEKLEEVNKIIQSHLDIKHLEENMGALNIACSSNSQILSEKHVQHICSIEKSPKKERYKPYSTLVNKEKVATREKGSQLISLPESMSLQSEQHSKQEMEKTMRMFGLEQDEENDTANEYSDTEDLEKLCSDND